MEICPVCKSVWKPIITRAGEQCHVCKLNVAVDCCSGVEDAQMEKTSKSCPPNPIIGKL